MTDPLWSAFIHRNDDLIKLLLIHGSKIRSDQYKTNKSIQDYLTDDKITKKWEAEFDDVGSLFTLIILVIDGYFVCKVDDPGKRFFEICSRLPIEMIMMISNLAFESQEIIVNSRRVELQLKN